MLAPIAIFAFNRPVHLQRTLDALAANSLACQSHVTIFCDGPRNDAERGKTDAVRAVAFAEIDKARFASVKTVMQECNRGLAPSIIAGVTSMLDVDERIIVVEDDLLTSPHFLRYMNDGLEVYAHEDAVASIHGYGFPHTVSAPPETFFLPGADCWGWATWRRAWDVFEEDAAVLLERIDALRLRHAFDVDGCYGYYEMLEAARDGKVSSWAVRWYAATFLAHKWTLHPAQSLVFNMGNDSSGTHCGTSNGWDSTLASAPVPVQPMPVATNVIMYNAYKFFLVRVSGGRWNLLKRRAKRLLRTWVLRYFPIMYGIYRALKK